jgi:hypothetical protein
VRTDAEVDEFEEKPNIGGMGLLRAGSANVRWCAYWRGRRGKPAAIAIVYTFG